MPMAVPDIDPAAARAPAVEEPLATEPVEAARAPAVEVPLATEAVEAALTYE